MCICSDTSIIYFFTVYLMSYEILLWSCGHTWFGICVSNTNHAVLFTSTGVDIYIYLYLDHVTNATVCAAQYRYSPLFIILKLFPSINVNCTFHKRLTEFLAQIARVFDLVCNARPIIAYVTQRPKIVCFAESYSLGK